MTVSDLADKLGLVVEAGEGGLDKEANGCYIGDLLSLAMSRVQAENVWITIQTNVNIVAVAVLTEAGCVVLCDGQKPDDAAKAKADSSDVPILTTPESAYEIAKKLAELGI